MNPPLQALTRHRLCHLLAATALGFLTTSCSQSAPLLKQQTPRGTIHYSLHSPKTTVRTRVVLAHGFLRSPQTMHHLADSLAKEDVETVCIQLRHSRPWAGNHRENARDLIALRKALGWNNVTYAGFSAGALSALIAASEDPACGKLLLLDPVDHGTLGKDAAAKIRIPTLAILGQPGPGNAQRNATPMLEAIANARVIEIPEATHCDFEGRPSALCHRLTGSAPDPARTTAVHEKILLRSTCFLNPQNQQP